MPWPLTTRHPNRPTSSQPATHAHWIGSTSTSAPSTVTSNSASGGGTPSHRSHSQQHQPTRPIIPLSRSLQTVQNNLLRTPMPSRPRPAQLPQQLAGNAAPAIGNTYSKQKPGGKPGGQGQPQSGSGTGPPSAAGGASR